MSDHFSMLILVSLVRVAVSAMTGHAETSQRRRRNLKPTVKSSPLHHLRIVYKHSIKFKTIAHHSATQCASSIAIRTRRLDEAFIVLSQNGCSTHSGDEDASTVDHGNIIKKKYRYSGNVHY